jgi:lipoic acid synthetase
MTEQNVQSPVRRLPTWFRHRLPSLEKTSKVRGLLDELGLATVCTGARCPNIGECFARGTATFMILGEVCTRDCRFCAIPHARPLPPRDDEPDAVAYACKRLGLRHVVITCVTRDDLPDGGAEHFARTVRAVRRELPEATIEVLTSDFGGCPQAIRTVLESGVEVFNHNIETVPRLYPLVRPATPMEHAAAIRRASCRRSLQVLARASQWAMENGSPMRVKSGVMVGLGETHREVLDVLADLRAVGCRMLTIGQYLAPSRQHVPVARFVPPDEFDQFRREALAMGFDSVASGPLVRSSYQAEKAISH